MRPLPLVRLLRLSLMPSALADAVAGTALALAGDRPPLAALALLPISALLYHAGMALNDWADRDHDRETRPDRPIPAGEVSPGAALCLSLTGFGMALAITWWAFPAALPHAAILATLIALYDLVGRGPMRGPLLLGACRALNLGLPLVALSAGGLTEWWPVCVTYGAWVALVSVFARAEDGDATLIPERQTRLLLAAALTLPVPALTTGILAGSPVGGALGVLLAASGTRGLLEAARTKESWTRERVERLTGAQLRRLMVLTASIALTTSPMGPAGLPLAVLILAGYPLAKALRKIAPPS